MFVLIFLVLFISVINVPYLTKYQHASPRRKDSGTYKIQAVNKYGQDTAELEIIVTCEYYYQPRPIIYIIDNLYNNEVL